MSVATRETVYAALFALANSLTTGGSPLLKDAGRRLKSLEDCQPENLPAVYQIQDDQKFFKPSTSLPAKMEWGAHWIVYGYSPDPAVAPSTVLNNVVEALVGKSGVLTPAPGVDKQTLGGIVEDAAVSGNIQIFEGLLGDKCVAIIPIRILVPGF